MTPDLDAVRAMMEEVTAGPWWTDGRYDGTQMGVAIIAARTDAGPLPGNPTRGLVAWSSAILNTEARTCEANARFIAAARELVPALAAEVRAQREAKDGAYLERNKLVALLASLYPSGIKRTAIEGWSADWHGCVYIDFPWGQASWHYHDSHAGLFEHLPPYAGEWDGHTTEAKYDAIVQASRAQRETIAGLEARVEALAGAAKWVVPLAEEVDRLRHADNSTCLHRISAVDLRNLRQALSGEAPNATDR